MPPTVSICIPAYNGADFIREAIDSCLNQTYDDFELIIVDDCSSDTTVEIARSYDDHRLRVETNTTNQGLVGNWQRCIDLASGEWLKYLFQDDSLVPTALERLLAVTEDTDACIAFSNRRQVVESTVSDSFLAAYLTYVDEHALQRRFPFHSFVSARQFADMMVDYPVNNCLGEPSAMLVRREAFNRFGSFDPEIIQLVDWEFAARVALHTGVAYVNEELVSVRIHGSSQSSVSRERDLLRRDYGDPLVILSRIVLSKEYQAVRDAAARRRPPVDLEAVLLSYVCRAREMATELDAVDAFDEAMRRIPTHSWLDAAIRKNILRQRFDGMG